jgi:hypothetical protein
MGYSNLDQLKLDKTAKVASPDVAGAAGANPTQTEYAAVVLLLNEIKAKLNAIFQV